MSPMPTAAPQAGVDESLLIAVAVALAVTALVAVGMVVGRLRAAGSPRLTVGIGAGSALALLAGALLVGALLAGGMLTRPPAAVADVGTTVKGVGVAQKVDLENFQLPTL